MASRTPLPGLSRLDLSTDNISVLRSGVLQPTPQSSGGSSSNSGTVPLAANFASPSFFSSSANEAFGLAVPKSEENCKGDAVNRLLTALEEATYPNSEFARRAATLAEGERHMAMRVTSLDSDLEAAAKELGHLERSIHQFQIQEEQKGQDPRSDDDGEEDDNSGDNESDNPQNDDKQEKLRSERKELQNDVESLKARLESQREELEKGRQSILESQRLMSGFGGILSTLDSNMPDPSSINPLPPNPTLLLPLPLGGPRGRGKSTVEMQSATIVSLSDENVELRKRLKEAKEEKERLLRKMEEAKQRLEQDLKTQSDAVSEKEATLAQIAGSLEKAQVDVVELANANAQMRQSASEIESVNRTLRAQLEVCSETESQLKSQILGLERKAAERQVLIESYEENVEQFSRDLLCYQENTAGRLDTARDESEQLRVKVVELSGALEEERTRRIERAQAFQELEARYTKLHQQSTEEAASSSKRESELAARATKAVTEAERLGTLLRDATARSNSLKLESNRLVREQNEASRRHQGEQEGLREKLMAGEKERRAQQREHELKVDGLFGDLKVLRGNVLSEKRRAEGLRQRNEELSKRVDELSKAHHTAAQETVTLQTELRRRTDEAQRLKDELYHATVAAQRSQQQAALQVDDARRSVEGFRQSEGEREREVLALRQTVRELRREGAALREELSGLRASSKALVEHKESLALSQAALEKSRLKADRLERMLETSEGETARRLGDQEAQIREERERAEAAARHTEEWREKCISMERELAEVRAENERRHRRMQLLVAERKELIDRNADLQNWKNKVMQT